VKIFRASVKEATALSPLSAPQMPGNLCRAQQTSAPQAVPERERLGGEDLWVQKVHDINVKEYLKILPFEEKD